MAHLHNKEVALYITACKDKVCTGVVSGWENSEVDIHFHPSRTTTFAHPLRPSEKPVWAIHIAV